MTMKILLNAVSTLTSKNQTTIPEPVRKALGLGKQDKLEYIISEEGVVTIQKAQVFSNRDSALLPFLNLLERDIHENPQNIHAVSAQELAETKKLVADVEIDLGEPL